MTEHSPSPVRIDVPVAVGLHGDLSTAAWVFAPSRPPPGQAVPGARPTVLFAFPGGGYSKSYFHMQVPGLPGYSMAEFMADRGIVVVACDNLAAGESSRPAPAESLTWNAMVAANQATVQAVLAGLRAGTAHPAMEPVGECNVIGLGHSMGGGLVTVQQATYRTFDAIAVLGRAIRGRLIPAPPEGSGGEPAWKPGSLQHEEFAATSEIVDGFYFQRRRTPWQRYLFYWDDVPAEVITADESHGTTFPLLAARQLSAKGGPNASAAAAVGVPLLLGFGERDVCEDPRAEVRAYLSATDIQLTVLPRSGHCHNLASSRAWLWERIIAWIGSLPPSGPG
jgi:hypothetical protein